MKKLICLLILIMVVCGCASVPFGSLNQKVNAYVDNFRKSPKYKELVLNASYIETFEAVINVFRDLDIKILKKDLESEVIFGSLYPEKYLNHYVAFFEKEKDNRTKVIFKASGMLLNTTFILEKIQEEIELQQKLNEDR